MTTSKFVRALTQTVAALALVAGMNAVAQAQTSSSTFSTADASVVIVAPIVLTNPTAMHFGNVVSGGSVGTVVLATDSSRTATGGTLLGNAGAAAAASFHVTGQSGATYAITVPGSALNLTGPGTTMTVTGFNTPSPTSTLTGGTDDFLVGATLNVGANQTPGTYTGQYSVTVAYN